MRPQRGRSWRGRGWGRRAAAFGLGLSMALSGVCGLAHGAEPTPERREGTDELRRLSLEEIRRRLKALDDEQNAALAAEDYEGALRLLQEINRLSRELERRSLGSPNPSPPGAPATPR